MTERRSNKGPWTHRALVWIFTVLLGILFYWLVGFVLADISDLPGPDITQMDRELIDSELLARDEALAEQIAEIQRDIEDQRQRQQVLRDSTDNSQRTMNQLLEFQRLSLEQGVSPSEEEQQALAESQQLFLQNQEQYQQINQQIAQLEQQLRDQQEAKRQVEGQLQTVREEVVYPRYQQRLELHNWKQAALKLAVLLPLLAVVIVLFWRGRGGSYAPMVYALGAALLVRVFLVMHEHFPRFYFKYILILSVLAVVAWALWRLLRMMAHPQRDWLLGQYRESYERFFCPVCTYPIRRGPLKYVFWNRRSIKRLHFPPPGQATADEPYTCPLCSTPLFEKCESCGQIRHSLLPACAHCGNERPVETIVAAGQPAIGAE